MTSATAPPERATGSVQNGPTVPLLENGDHLDQRTFHERYEAMPEGVKAELIEGVVYTASPLKPPHGRMHFKVSRWLAEYEEATPGVEGFDNTTNILGPTSEPQPDLCLIVRPECGGRVRLNEAGFFAGPPELVVEVASSSASIDLHAKRRDYERHGVQEYVVVAVRQDRVYWFALRDGRFEPLSPGPDGVVRSEVFPGLWLLPAALLRLDTAAILAALRPGLASPEHAAFVAKLESARAQQ